jgi:GntR family transcriptional repressor for pyruvate dehydrogenase complex
VETVKESTKDISPGSPVLEAVSDSDKISSIVSILRDYIVAGNLEPGTELPAERSLAEQLGVSRFSLREALRVAQAQGLIEISRGRRPRVAKPGTAAASEVIGLAFERMGQAFEHLVEARQILECQIARLAATRASESHIATMQETIEQMVANKDDIATCGENDFRFHNALLEASGNVIFRIMLEPLAELLRKSRRETMLRRGVDRAISGHRKILAAVMEGDSDKAAEAMSLHLKMAAEDLEGIKQPNKD